MIIGFRGGLTLSGQSITLVFDAAARLVDERAIRLVSHAHADHAPSRYSEKTIMTPETQRIASSLRQRLGQLLLKRLGEKIRPDDSVEVRLLNAGHVLGSSQFYVETPDCSLLYTGDLNTYETLITKPAAEIEADTLVIESTYGEPSYIFPAREAVYSDIVRWVSSCIREGSIPAFKTYSVGKSQEIIALINRYTHLPVVVGEYVEAVSRAYGESGVRLEFVPASSREGREIMRGGGCVYVDSVRRGYMSFGRRVRWAVATGWAVRYRYRSYDAAFPLSGHADYRGLLEFVQRISPKKTYVMHGFTNSLSSALRRMGYDATPLDSLAINGVRQLVFE